MIPIAKPWIGEEEKKEVEKVLDSGYLSSGEWVKRFEKEFSSYVGVKHALATTNGTQALILALEAIGIKNREVIVPSFSFISSAISIIRAGGKPVFVDVDEKTYNIDPEDVPDILPALKCEGSAYRFSIENHFTHILAVSRRESNTLQSSFEYVY